MSEVQSTVEYRNIQGVPGYRVGDDGSVWTCLKAIGRGTGGGRGVLHTLGTKWRKLIPRPTNKGYYRVQLSGKDRYIHRLVLEAFVGPCPEGMEACHFPDHKRSNNRRDNLRWDTPVANQADRVTHGNGEEGEGNAMAKLTDDLVRGIRDDYAKGGVTQAELSIKYHVVRPNISLIINRRTWKHI